MDKLIQVEGFAKTFHVGFWRRPSVGAKDISFEVEAGEIFGFLGPNGAGKTTTIKAMLGLIRPDGGTIRVLGAPPESMAWREGVGYMPEHPTFYDYLSGREVVTWFGLLSGLGRAEAASRAANLLDRVGLGHALDRRLRGYSKGMLQRTGLATALVSDPKLLVLDEPMTGLDPIGRKEIRELILSLKDEGRTVFYSTHILPDIEMTCDRVAIIDQGVTRRMGRLQDILTETTKGIDVIIEGFAHADREQWAEKGVNVQHGDGKLVATFDDIEDARAFAQDAISRGGRLSRFEPHRDDLESIFVRSLGQPS